MKNLILCFTILISVSTYAQNCNIGNEDTTGFVGTGNVQADYLLGNDFTLAKTGTLNSINLIGRNTGAKVKMAVYDDLSGRPNKLLVESAVATVGTGVISLPVTPTTLAPGTYWIMAVYDTYDKHTYIKDNTLARKMAFMALPFSSALPTTSPKVSIRSTSSELTYFLDIKCGNSTGIESNLTHKNVNVYPNPATDFIQLSTINNADMNVEIFDLTGKKLKELVVYANQKMDITKLEKGVYVLVIDSKTTRKIVKL